MEEPLSFLSFDVAGIVSIVLFEHLKDGSSNLIIWKTHCLLSDQGYIRLLNINILIYFLMVKHNNVIPNVHLRKHWQKNVKVWLNQASRKKRRLNARRAKAAAIAPRPLDSLRPAVRCQTIRYNHRLRMGKGTKINKLRVHSGRSQSSWNRSKICKINWHRCWSSKKE